MPEIAAAWLVGAIFTFLVVNWNLYFVHRSFRKEAFLSLNHNLSKVNRYWSLEQGGLVNIEPGQTQMFYQEIDHRKATRAAFIFGTMMIFLSWAGLILFFVYFVSIQKLAKTRIEERIFESSLVSDRDLSESQVRALLKELEEGAS